MDLRHNPYLRMATPNRSPSDGVEAPLSPGSASLIPALMALEKEGRGGERADGQEEPRRPSLATVAAPLSPAMDGEMPRQADVLSSRCAPSSSYPRHDQSSPLTLERLLSIAELEQQLEAAQQPRGINQHQMPLSPSRPVPYSRPSPQNSDQPSQRGIRSPSLVT